jgi:branched-chain amino acid transport system permease protein
MEIVLISLLNGFVYGMLLFMLASGLTLIFSMMGVLNFAHAGIYMIGAYVAFQTSQIISFWAALIVAPIVCAAIGAAIEIWGLRRTHHNGHIAELLFTFGLFFIIERGVQMVWGMLPVPYRVPAGLDFPLFSLYGIDFPAYHAFMLLVAGGMLLAIWLMLKHTRIGLIIQASLTHPQMVSSLGHNVPRVFTIVFAVVVFGGLGSLVGCFISSIVIGMVQTFAVAIDGSLADLFGPVVSWIGTDNLAGEILSIPVSRVGPLLPYALMVLILVFRPRGLMGTRDT